MSESTVQTAAADNAELAELLKTRLNIVKGSESGYLAMDGADFIGAIGPDYIMFCFDGEQVDEYLSNYVTEGGFLQAVDYQIRYAFANEGAPLLIDPNHVIGADVPSYS